MRPSISTEDTLLHAILRGAAPAWPASSDSALAERFLAAGARHGVQPLAYHLLSPAPVWDHWPPTLRQSLRRQTWRESARETLGRDEVAKALEALTAGAVQPLLMKGAALAYSHYPVPCLRPRVDTDLWSRPEDRDAAQTVLPQLGYTSPPAVSGDWVSYQRMFSKTSAPGYTHTLDVHWRLSNGELFARSLDYRDLFEGSVAAPAFGARARALGDAHALLLACMHRVDHFTQGHQERLIWLYDIHLLVGAMTGPALSEFAGLALNKRMAAVCLDALKAAQRCFTTPVPAELAAALAAPGTPEPSARLLGATPLRSLWSHYLALPGWRAKTAFLRESILPPAAYMRARYGASAPLSLLYLQRGILGLRRRLGGQ